MSVEEMFAALEDDDQELVAAFRDQEITAESFNSFWPSSDGFGLPSQQILPSALPVLRGLAKKSSVRTTEVTLTGTLSTVSKDHQQELTLADGVRVRFKADEEQLKQLASLVLSPITVLVSEKNFGCARDRKCHQNPHDVETGRSIDRIVNHRSVS